MNNYQKIIIVFFILAVFVISAIADEIHNAARQGDLTKVKKLVDNNSELVNSKEENGLTPLHFAALGSHIHIAELLLLKGAKVNAEDNNGRTPLFFASRSGSIDICQLLIAKGAVIDKMNKYKRTPLLYAIWGNHKECVDFLITKGADVNLKDTDGYTPLHHISMDGLKDIAEMLISKGANIKLKDNTGHTPLHTASNYGHKEIVEILINKKVDVNIKDDEGDTPLHGAAWVGHKDMVELLISNDAEINARNNDNKTPLDNAKKVGHKEVVELLIAKGAISSSKEKKVLKSKPIRSKDDVGEQKLITMTILYNNYINIEGTKAEWGFSCLIEGTKKTILFDTGGDSKILMHNINHLNIDLSKVEQIVISHNHWDHIGGLSAVLAKKPQTPVYLPYSFPYDVVRKVEKDGGIVIPVNEPIEICDNVFLTGEMGDSIKEQSLIVNTPKGMIIVTGCSHQGIVNILKKAKEILSKDINLVFGGFHLMRHSDDEVKAIIQQFKKYGVKKCGATHCTGDRAIALFKKAFGENYLPIGTGKVLKISEKGIE